MLWVISFPVTVPAKSDASTVLAVIFVGGALLVGSLIWMGMRPRKKSAVKTLPGELPQMGSLDGNAVGEDFFSIDIKPAEPADSGQSVAANPEACHTATAESGVSH